MPSDKLRLYVALYARGGTAKMPEGEDYYHWALLMGPKNEARDASGKRFHAKQTPIEHQGTLQMQWGYEERDISLGPTAMILVRIRIAKVKDAGRVKSLLRDVPVGSGQADWNCVTWVKEALDVLRRDERALSTNLESWETIRYWSMSYAHSKNAAHRFDGQAPAGTFDTDKVATYDLLEMEETIP